jgi:hypothetical protein
MVTRGARRRPPAPAALLNAPDGSVVRIQVIPPDDGVARELTRAWVRLAPDRTDVGTFRQDLQAVLRRLYPLLVLQPQDRFATVSDDEVWYCFRDGRVRSPNDRREDLYAALADARETTANVRETMGRSLATLEQATRPRPARSRPTETADPGPS